jgi:hypothetical protein
MRQRAVLVLCGALLAVAWGLAILVFASPGAVVRVGVFVVFLCLTAALTWWAVELLVREWRGRVGRFRAVLVSWIATLATLWLALTEATIPSWAQALLGLLLLLVPLAGLVFGLVLVARALIRRRRKDAPLPHSPRSAHDQRLAEKAFEARAAKGGYRG